MSVMVFWKSQLDGMTLPLKLSAFAFDFFVMFIP
jgi:hypothetical protein